jgi:AAA ATPase domain/MalT-like TPR region
MNLERSQKRIRDLMSLFVTQVKSATAMGQTDINKVAETILIPLIAEVYGYRNLKNLNFTEGSNFPSVDLGDETARVAFQITATPGIEKVKHTLTKFFEYKLDEKYDRIIIYIITEKQNSYSDTEINRILQGKFIFDVKKDIWDWQNILGEVTKFQIEKTREVEKILEANFGEERREPDWEVVDKVEQIINKSTELFVGRSEEFQKLDNFLADNSSGVMLVKAAAGSGKTALLANWVKERQGNGCFIADHFFSQQYDKTRSVKSAYWNLLRQIYRYYELYYEQLPNEREELRKRLNNILKERGAREDKPLVIVIDGLDEIDAADIPFSLPFLTSLPQNVFVIASARAESGEEPKYLENWSERSQKLHLERLPRGAIADWLKQTGDGELATFADDNNFVAQLDEITQGFPLYLNFLTDELSHAAKQKQDIRQLLAQTPKGFENYVKQQLKHLDELDLPDERWQFFALLAVAKGVLEKKDVTAITGMRDRSLRQLHQCWQVTRWIRISEDKFYAFAHPLLGTTFAIELGDDAQDALEKLINYCSHWQEQEHSSPYALRHYAEHLRDVKHWEELYAIARNADFYSHSIEQFPHEPDLPLKTVQTALLAAAEEDKAGEMAEFLLIHAQRLLQTTAQDLPLEALRKGSLERACKLANLYEIERSVLWYLLLAWELKDTGRLEKSRETLKRLKLKNLPRLSTHPAIDWQSEYAAYLLAHLFDVSEDVCTVLQQKLLENVYRNILCRDLSDRGNFAAALKTVLGISSNLEQMLALINIAKKQVQKGDAEVAASFANVLENAQKLLPNFGVEFLIGKIAKTQIELGDREAARVTLTESIETAYKIENEQRRVNAIVALANIQVELGMVAEALDTLQKIEGRLEGEDCYCFKNLAELQTKLGQSEKGRVTFVQAKKIAHGIEDENSRVNALQKIAIAQAEAKEFDDAIETAEEIKNQQDRADAFRSIVSVQINAKDFPAALATANRIEEPLTKSRSLLIIAHAQVSSGDFTAALKTTEEIEIESDKTNTLVVIANAQAGEGDVTAALNIAEKIEDRFQQIDILVAIVKGQARSKNFTAALEMVEEIDNQLEPTEEVMGVMRLNVTRGEVSLRKTVEEIKNQKQGEALVAVVEALIEMGDFTAAITTKNKIKDKNQQQEALSAIAKGYAKTQNFTAASEIAKEIESPPTRAKTLVVIAEAQVAHGKTEAARTTFATVLQAEKQTQISISLLISSALIQVAEVQVKNGQKELGAATTSLACEIAQSIDYVAEKANVLAIVARILVEAEKIEEAKPICDSALEIAQQISNNREHHRSQSFALIAQAQAMMGDFDSAIITIRKICIPSSQAYALKTLANLQIWQDSQQIEKFKIILSNAHEFYKNADDRFFLFLSNKVDVLTTIAVAQSTVGETEAALATLAELLEDALAQESHKRNNRNDDLFTIAAAYAEAGKLATAINVTDKIEDGWLQLRALRIIIWEQFKKGEKEALLKTFDAALQAKDKIEDEKKRVEALKAIAQIQVLAGCGEQTVKTVEAIVTNRNQYLPKVAAFLVETGDKPNFKKLLIPCAYYLDSAYEMCGYLARLYPEQASAVAKVLRELNGKEQ